MKDIYQVIDTVLISEKATLLQEKNNEYVFKVDRNANKLEIKRAIRTALRQESRHRPHPQRSRQEQAQPPRRCRPHCTLEKKPSSASRTARNSISSNPAPDTNHSR